MTPTEALFALKASTEDVRRQLDRVPFASVREAFNAWESAWIAWAESVTARIDAPLSPAQIGAELGRLVADELQGEGASHAT